MVEALKPQDRTNTIHVSDLTICPYRIVRDKLSDVFIPMQSAAKMLRGQYIDLLSMSHTRPNAIYQGRYSKQLCGVEIWGTPDVIDLDRQTIEDYKAPGSRMKHIPDNYKLQLNAYYWLTEGILPVPIKNLYLNVIAPKEVQVLKVPKWHLYDTECELSSRLLALLDVMEMGTDGPVGTCGDFKCIYCKPASIIRVGEVIEGEVIEGAD